MTNRTKEFTPTVSLMDYSQLDQSALRKFITDSNFREVTEHAIKGQVMYIRQSEGHAAGYALLPNGQHFLTVSVNDDNKRAKKICLDRLTRAVKKFDRIG